MAGNQGQQWEGRAHFFAAAAEAMRRILIDRARRKRALRRGGDQERVDLEELELACPTPDDQLLDSHLLCLWRQLNVKGRMNRNAG